MSIANGASRCAERLTRSLHWIRANVWRRLSKWESDSYRFLVFRRALMRVLIDETANAPLASPARTSVGFSGESPQSVPPPNWARAGMERHRAREKGSPTYSNSFFIDSGPLTF